MNVLLIATCVLSPCLDEGPFVMTWDMAVWRECSFTSHPRFILLCEGLCVYACRHQASCLNSDHKTLSSLPAAVLEPLLGHRGLSREAQATLKGQI